MSGAGASPLRYCVLDPKSVANNEVRRPQRKRCAGRWLVAGPPAPPRAAPSKIEIRYPVIAYTADATRGTGAACDCEHSSKHGYSTARATAPPHTPTPPTPQISRNTFMGCSVLTVTTVTSLWLVPCIVP